MVSIECIENRHFILVSKFANNVQRIFLGIIGLQLTGRAFINGHVIWVAVRQGTLDNWPFIS